MYVGMPKTVEETVKFFETLKQVDDLRTKVTIEQIKKDLERPFAPAKRKNPIGFQMGGSNGKTTK